MEVYLGLIFPSALNFAPVGTSYCNGQLLNVAQNATMYSLLGNIYGGNTTNFNLPDLRGRTAIGATTMGGPSPSPVVGSYPLGKANGVEATTLSILNMPAHTHSAQTTLTNMQGSLTGLNIQAKGAMPANAGLGSTNVPGGTAGYPAQIPDMSGAGLDNTFYGASDGSTTIPVNVSVSPVLPASVSFTSGSVSTVVGATGGGTPFSSYQPSLALSYLIIMQGLYPPRP
jgi:microcystin-dependent protein